MDTKTATILALYLCTLMACDCKDVDVFGLRPTIEVPIRSFPARSNFTVGDTLWWEADFSNQVAVRNVEQRIDLSNFEFFPLFNIQSVEGNLIWSDTTISVTPIIGDAAFAFSDDDALFYEVVPIEDNEKYVFKFGIALLEPGIYVAGISTLSPTYDFYDHPALYACGGRKREVFETNYINSSSNRTDYETIFEVFGTPTLLESTTYEKYAAVGGISFTVTE